MVSWQGTHFIYQGGEDFRTALQRAHKFFVELDLLGRSRFHQSASAASSSTSNDFQSSEAFEIDRNRVEIMNRLIEILQRNLRVRYELKILDVLKSCVPFALIIAMTYSY